METFNTKELFIKSKLMVKIYEYKNSEKSRKDLYF